MKSFKDSGGRTWALAINIDTVKRVKSLVQVDLTDMTAGDPPLVARLGIDVILLCDVLYAVCKPQADKEGVSDEQFGQAMGGDALVLGQQALMEELTDFFQKLGRREVARMIETQAKLIQAAVSQAEKRIEAIDVEKIVENMLNRPTDGNSSTDVPEPWELTPAPSLSENSSG